MLDWEKFGFDFWFLVFCNLILDFGDGYNILEIGDCFLFFSEGESDLLSFNGEFFGDDFLLVLGKLLFICFLNVGVINGLYEVFLDIWFEVIFLLIWLGELFLGNDIEFICYDFIGVLRELFLICYCLSFIIGFVL